MFTLRVSTFRRVANRLIEPAENIRFGDRLHRGVPWQSRLAKAIAKVPGERRAVCQEPRLHALDHQMALLVAGTLGTNPAVSLAEVVPRSGRRHRSLCIHQQHGRPRIRRCSAHGGPKAVVRVPSTTARDDSRHSARKSRPAQKLREPPAALGAERLRVSSSLDIESPAHQRVPPISPRVQRSPSLYFFNHGSRSVLLRRVRRVAPSCFSQTIIASGTSVRASTRMSE